MPDASILIPVLNEERYIESSLAAMQRQRFDGELEFIFADGGSTDRTHEILERLAAEDPRIVVIDNPAGTVSSGLNVALRHARGRWAVRMDAHTVYPEDYVRLGVERLSRGDTRWVSGPQVPVGHGPVSRAVAMALGGAIGRGGSRKWGRREGEEFELDTGVFAGVWERATLLEYGGWDERWPRNSDSEMAARFLARGERLICVPGMAAEYVPRDSLHGLWRQYLGYGEYRARTYRHHPHSMRPSHLLPPGLVLDAAGALIGPVRRPARLGLAVYGAVLAALGLRTRDPLVPVVLAVMHVAHGVGQIRGWIKFGPPLHLLGLLASAEADEPVHAPSLRS